MLNKIVNTIVSGAVQVLGLRNTSNSQPTMHPHQHPHNQPNNQGYQNYPSYPSNQAHHEYNQQLSEYQIPPHLDPHINPSANWEYYRQLLASQEFVRSQTQHQQYQYQQQAMYSQVLDNLRSQRVEWESQQLANGASPEYYAKLNQAYQRGINQNQSNSTNSRNQK